MSEIVKGEGCFNVIKPGPRLVLERGVRRGGLYLEVYDKVSSLSICLSAQELAELKKWLLNVE